MAQDLREMLRASTDSAPTDPTDLGMVLAAGRRRVRRRRVTASVAVAVMTAAAVAVPTLLPRLGGADPGPAGPVQPVGRVVHLSSAVDAKPGRDYTVLTSLRTGDLDQENGTALGPLTDDGRVVVQDGPHGIGNVSRWGLLDPATERTDWFPAIRQKDGPQSLVGVDGNRLVMTTDLYDAPLLTLWTLDRATREWTRIEVDVSGSGLSLDTLGGMTVDRGRFYFAVRTDGRSLEQSRLWSASLTGTHTARDEGFDVGTFDVDDGVVVYMRYDNRPTSEMHVRDLATGKDERFDSRSGRHCNQLGLQRIGENVALWQYCGTHHGVRDDRAQVVTLAGEPVVTVQDDDLDPAGMGTRFVSVTSHRDGHAGTYVWDLKRDRLLRLSDGFSRFAGGEDASGDRLLWSTPVLQGKGRTMWVADLR